MERGENGGGTLHTFALPSDFIPEDVDLVDLAVLFKHLPQVVLVHGAGDLAHKHLDGVRIRLVSRHR